MAQIDTSILQSFKPVQLESPMNQMANLYQLQGAQQANQLRGMQMAAAEREIADRNALNTAYQAGLTPEGTIDYGKVMQSLAQGGQGAQVPGVQKAMREEQKTRMEGLKAQNEAIKERLSLSRDALDRIDPASPMAAQQYLAWHNANHTDPVLGPYLQSMGANKDNAFTQINQAIQTGKLPQLIEQSKLGVTKVQELHQPKPQQVDLHDRSVLIDMNPRSPTFKQELSSQKKGRTEQEIITAEETARHNRQTEAAAWKRLQAETSSGDGVITPQTLDMVANIYLKTGQLPPLGIGKKAADVKLKVLQRATELGAAAPAEVAEKVIGGKQDVAARTQTVKNFSSGVEGRAVRSFNTAIDHLETMDKLATALENNDTRAFNSVGNFFSKQTGSAAPANFEAAKAIVGGEVAKALTGANMALKDREEIRDAITSASSPAQLKGTLNTLKQLLGGQLSSLNIQYETGTGRKDFAEKLSPASKAELAKLRGEQKPAATRPAPPKAGAVQDGYRFKGGDPANKANWEKL